MSKYSVSAPNQESRLYVMNLGDKLPTEYVLEMTRAKHSAVIRVAGGCSGMGDGDKTNMLNYFDLALKGVACALWSGGTRVFKGDNIDQIVTEVPGFIAQRNPGCIALGSLPRVDTLAFTGEYGQLTPDRSSENEVGFNTANSANLVVQHPDRNLDWDGDVVAYLEAMKYLKMYSGFASGVIVWNGGGVTKKEAKLAADYGLEVFLISGTGRAADELSQDCRFTNKAVVTTVDVSNPVALNTILKKKGFIK